MEKSQILEEKRKREQKKKKPYFQRFNHKMVVVTLINGEKLVGKLHASPNEKYDVLLEDPNTSKRILIPKHSILFMAEVEKGE